MKLLSKRNTPFKALLGTLAVVLLLPAGWAGYKHLSLQLEIAQWNPAHAGADAALDIENGAAKIYLNGTMSSSLVGLTPEQRALVAHLPVADAGVGCVVGDDDLFDARRAYAVRYNRAVAGYLAAKTAAL